ncbi:MAG: 3-isopropylmalate dehydratase small subunit [Burkholderiales bacterium]
MIPFTKITGVAAPLDLANIDTDKIIPARFLRRLREPGYEKLAFHDVRYDANGHDRPDFVLNQAPYRKAKILVAGANFGCGSSREAAVYVMWDWGIRAVIAPSFGDIHYGNELQNGMLPVILPDATCEKLRGQLHDEPGAQIAVDLESQTVTGPDGATYRFDIDTSSKERLLKGLDDIGLVMQNIREIETFEKKHHDELPWLA